MADIQNDTHSLILLFFSSGFSISLAATQSSNRSSINKLFGILRKYSCEHRKPLSKYEKRNFATRCGGKTHTKCYAASSNSLESPFHQKHDNPTCTAINPFTNDKFWTFPNYEFTDDNFNFGENGRNLYKRVEHTAGKGEIAHYKQFLLFPQCFQMTCTADM